MVVDGLASASWPGSPHMAGAASRSRQLRWAASAHGRTAPQARLRYLIKGFVTRLEVIRLELPDAATNGRGSPGGRAQRSARAGHEAGSTPASNPSRP